MTKDIIGSKNKILLPDGTEKEGEINREDRPKWPYKQTQQKNSCPFSLIYKKWVVHPDDKTKHPAYMHEKTDGLSQDSALDHKEKCNKNNEALS
jgi:hypothetical protein